MLAALPAAAQQGRPIVEDFPPGSFSDGGHYKLEDFKGKVLVLFFYESTCPTCRATIPKINQTVLACKDMPVKFIAVGASDTIQDVSSYVRETKLAMPAFVDSVGAMEGLWAWHLSLRNIYQFPIIGPQGQLLNYSVPDRLEADVQQAVKGVKWKYKDQGYDAKLKVPVELFEWNQYEQGMRLLKPLRKSAGKGVAESAEKLFEQVKQEGTEWKAQADKLAEEKPVAAFDLYTRISNVFGDDELGKSVQEPLKKLKADKKVEEELAARKMLDQLYTAMPKATTQQRGQVEQYCLSIAKKYPTTVAGQRAEQIAKAIEFTAMAEKK
jgi:thiol-disulfide isomerase/thioredoxin